VGVGRTGTGGGGDCPDAPGLGRLPGYRGRAATAPFSCPAGRGVWESRTPEEGLAALAEALGAIQKRGPYSWEVELHRVKGELLLKKSESRPQSSTPNAHAETEAEACFQKAIEVARRQSAKSLELRAATSLARLWQQQGKKAEAHQMLADIYGWFTEGFDTKDLQEAKTLLEELT
jgi:predicted ATPase